VNGVVFVRQFDRRARRGVCSSARMPAATRIRTNSPLYAMEKGEVRDFAEKNFLAPRQSPAVGPWRGIFFYERPHADEFPIVGPAKRTWSGEVGMHFVGGENA